LQINAPFSTYEERLDRVLSYIYENLDEDLSLDQLAEIACMSRYHWHRVFLAMTGETLSGMVRRMRLTWAANALVETEMPLRSIASQVGYQNLSSFSRSFKRAHGLSPKEFRQKGRRKNELSFDRPKGKNMYSVTIKDMSDFRAAGVLHKGPYRKLGGAFNKLGSILMAKSLMQEVSELFVIYHDPPESKPDEDLRSHVAVKTQSAFPSELKDLEYFNVDGGQYAVLEHTGPYPTLKSAYDWLYGHWLPNSGMEPRDAPPLEVYINDPRKTSAAELRTDIRLPLQ